MQGSPFDSRFNMEATLNAQIENAVWNSQWSNTALDHDRVNSTLYFLNWQSLMPTDRKPFKGRNLLALMVMGYLGPQLLSTVYKPGKAPVGLGIMESVVWDSAARLSKKDAHDFLELLTASVAFLSKEKKRRNAAEAGVQSPVPDSSVLNAALLSQGDEDMVDGTGREGEPLSDAKEVVADSSSIEDDDSATVPDSSSSEDGSEGAEDAMDVD